MTVYIDKDYKCHANQAEGLTPIETGFFDGKCDAFIEGYCYKAVDNEVHIYPWKPSDVLDEAQRAYERQLLAELQANSIAIAELEAEYQKGVNSAYD